MRSHLTIKMYEVNCSSIVYDAYIGKTPSHTVTTTVFEFKHLGEKKERK